MQNSISCPFEIGPEKGHLAERLSIGQFQALYDEHGVILFRDVAKSSEDFLAISSRFGKAWIPYQFGGRDTVSRSANLQTVNTGRKAIVAHAEMSHMPMQPQSAWFFCESPPREMGATTLYDGLRIAATMPDDLRNVLDGRKFLYRRRQPIRTALKIYGVENEQEFQRMIDAADWSECLRIDASYLYQDYVVPTFPIHPATGQPVFANMLVHNARLRRFYGFFHELFSRNRSLRPFFDPFIALFDRLPTGLSRVPQPYGVALYPTFENQQIVPRWVIRELQQHYLEHQVAVSWHSGDILAIDNTRFMHGRQAIVDDERRILTRFGYPCWVDPAHEFKVI